MRCTSRMLTITMASLLAIVTSGLEAQATSVIAVFHQGQSNDGHLWESYFNGTNWEPDQQVQGIYPNGSSAGPVGMIESPSAVVFDGGLYVFHQGIGVQVGPEQVGDFQLWVSYFDGSIWHPDTPAGTTNSILMVASPSAVWFAGEPSDTGLYVFHQGARQDPNVGITGDLQLWYSWFNGTSWGQDTPFVTPSIGMSESPSAIAYPPGAGGGLYVFHQDSGGAGQLWYSHLDGASWQPDQQVQNVGMSESPSAVEFGSGFLIFHQGYGQDGTLWYSHFDGASWQPDQQVQNVGMSESPSAVNVPGLGLCVFHQGYAEDGWLWQTCFNGTNWTPDQQVQGTYSNGSSTGPVGISGSPSAVVYPPQ